jgi:hypothetical protein
VLHVPPTSTSKLVAPLKFIYSSIQVSDILVLTVHFKLINFAFQIYTDTQRDTQCNISEDSILHNHRRDNLKSYIALAGWTL